MSLQPYEKYKDTEIGTLPSSWEVIRIKDFLNIKKSLVGENSSDYTLLSLTLNGIVKRDMDNPQGKFPAEFNSYKIVDPGDLILCLFDVDETPRTVGLSHEHGMITGAYDIFASHDLDVINYLYLYFLAIDNVKGLKPLYKGLRKVVPIDSFRSMKVPLPPKGDLILINKYLKLINTYLNDYVKTKKKYIQTLERYKEALIHSTISGKINVETGQPYNDYKQSTIKWVPEIPNHWTEKRLRSIASVKNSNVDKNTDENEISVRLCNYVDVYKNENITTDINFMEATATEDEIKNFRLKIDDVIITKDSEMWNDIGVPALVTEEETNLICGYHLSIIRCDTKSLKGDYLRRQLQDPLIASQLYIQANGVTRYGLSLKSIKDMQLIVPPIKEQEKIAAYLSKKVEVIDKVIYSSLQEISLIKSYKKSLLETVVKGNVDVTEIAHKLQDISTDDDYQIEVDQEVPNNVVAFEQEESSEDDGY